MAINGRKGEQIRKQGRITDAEVHRSWISELWRCRKYHNGVGTREQCVECAKQCCKRHGGKGDEQTCPVCMRR